MLPVDQVTPSDETAVAWPFSSEFPAMSQNTDPLAASASHAWVEGRGSCVQLIPSVDSNT